MKCCKIIIGLLLFGSVVYGQNNDSSGIDGYDFKNYSTPVEIVKINPDSLFYAEGTWQFHSTIKSSVEENKCKPNFAGHYMVVYWGCGSPCQQAAIVNLKTKQVIFGPNATSGFVYHTNSRLLIASPYLKDWPNPAGTTEIYELKDDKMILLKSNEWNSKK